MSIQESIVSVLSKYATFDGRARRSEYWWFYLVNTIISSVLSGIGKNVTLFSILALIYSLAVLIPGLAVCVRRLHDVGKSGWYIFMALIPIAGPIILIVKLATDSEPGTNAYGENPKEGGYYTTDSSNGAY